MSPTTHPEEQSTEKRGRMAWLPIFLLLAAIIAARVAGLRESYESNALRLFLSFSFYTVVSLGTLYLIGRSFLASGSPGLLLLECGVVLWSLAGTVGDLVYHGDANINITIFNIGILLAGVCHLAGTILTLNPQRMLRARALWLGAGCGFSLGVLWLVSQAALLGWLPVFFIQGHGGTLVRHAVLISAIAMFVLSAGVLHANERVTRLPFTYWYKLALLMLAVGLFGIMIQVSLGSLVNWLSRTAQWLGGLYLLFAALASLRESDLPLFPVEKKSHPAYYRDAVAVAVVFAAAAIRLAFLSAMGRHAPYLVFFPAVIFAALYGGLRPGLLATVMSAILIDYFWLEPVYQFKIEHLYDQLSIAIFLLSGGMVSWVTDSMNRARTRASAAEAQVLLAAEREKAAGAVREAREYAESIIATLREPLVVLDAGLRVISANRSFHQTFQVNQDETYGRLIYELGNQQWNIPRLREFLEAILPKNATFADFEVEHDFPYIGRRIMLLNGRRLYRETNRTEMILLAIEDITVRKQAEEALRQSEARLRVAQAVEVERQRLYDVLETLPAMICLLTPDYHVAFANRSFREKFGESAGRHCYEYCFGRTEPCEFCESYKVLKTGKPHHWEVAAPDGSVIDAYDFPFTDVDGSPLILEMDIDITERKRTEEALRKAHDQVRFFASQCLTAQETERKRIAGEIHDSIGASLAAAKFKVEEVITKVGENRPETRATLGGILSMLQEVIQESRRIQLALRPSMLDDIGILATINWFCRQFESTYSHIHIGQEINIEESEVPVSLRTVIFRLLQEALNNIAKHSKADRVNLVLRKMDSGIELRVQDNGQGFDTEEPISRVGTAKGLGLASMRERAELSGGFFSIESSKRSGTVIRATWPLNS